MKKFLNDLKAASAFFKDLRRQKPDGNSCNVTEYCFMDTVEGTVMFNYGKDIYVKANEFFKTLPYEVKKSLSFSFKYGNYIDRADFWRQALESVLTEREYHIAVRKILRWYIHCKQLKMEGA